MIKLNYEIIDSITNINVADSFVKYNKIGKGGGEARLYVGSLKQERITAFFGKLSNKNNAFIEKKHLLEYLEKARYEYMFPSYNYLNKINMLSEYSEYIEHVKQLENIVYFSLKYALDKNPKRCYVRGDQNSVYSLLRSILLPNISYINIYKVHINNTIKFLFVPFMNLLYDSNHHPGVIDNINRDINSNTSLQETVKDTLIKARVGQGKFRDDLLNEYCQCYVTQVTEPKLLIASHIKPWSVSDNKERLDVNNGLLLTPTFDRLFDQGLITFVKQDKILVSKLLDKQTVSKLKISEYEPFIINYQKRKKYLDYHNEYIFTDL